MQDEINEKTIALYIKTGKLTAQTLQKAMKDPFFRKAEFNANAQQLCCYRPERHRLNRVREALAAGQVQNQSAEYD